MACDRRRDMRQALRARFIQRFPSSRKSAMKGVQMANRPKLTIEDQVAYMKNKGITFDHCSEKDAVRFLQESTYFFKVKAFDKNYIAHPKTGHYYNLDFSYLMELSTLDMRLRRLILHATLDIEHFLKVQLIRDVSSNPVEDGYQIVEKFFSENSSVKNSISEKSKNSMCKDLVEKLESENYAIWNLIEVLSFGDFVRLYTLYDREYGNHNKGLIQCLYAVRCLRNAAAHNNCLLNSLRLPYTRKIHSSYSISRAVSQIPNGPKTTSREKKSISQRNCTIYSTFVWNGIATISNQMSAYHLPITLWKLWLMIGFHQARSYESIFVVEKSIDIPIGIEVSY